MSSPDPTPTRTAPCPTCGQPALWAYEPPIEGCLCYCLCQGSTLAWTPTDPPAPTGTPPAPTVESPAAPAPPQVPPARPSGAGA